MRAEGYTGRTHVQEKSTMRALGEVIGDKLIVPQPVDPEARAQLEERTKQALNGGCTRYDAFLMLSRFFDPRVVREVFPEFTAPRAAPAGNNATALAVPQQTPTSTLSRCEQDELAFQYVPLIQCSFPHSDVSPANAFTRRNGRLELTIATSRVELGLPYGTPARLLTIFITTEIVRTRSREVWLGRSLQDFLKKIGVPITRGERGSMAMYANQLQRLIHTQFSINETMEDGAGRQGLRFRQTLLFEDGLLWWDDDFVTSSGSTLLVHDGVFQSMLERSAPLQASAIQELRKSPMDLDVYAWLVHRLYTLGRPSRVLWDQLSAQIGHTYTELRVFRHWFLKSLRRVHSVYPEANFTVEDSGILLKPSRPHVQNRAIRELLKS
jgi:hypothetical protein